MTFERPEALDYRILVFAPVGKDGALAMDVLQRAELNGFLCRSAGQLCDELTRGAAVIILTEEALEDASIGELMEALRNQPAWSDIPILLFADAERSEVYLRTLRLLEGLRNVVLLERPIRLGAALSLIRSAIRGRQRQYELRDLLYALAEAREEAEAANRLKDEFLATLSHELRTPLNAILGWTTMLRDGNVQPNHVARALETIQRNAMAQVQIVNDLLDVSRIVRGAVQLSPALVSMGPLLTLAVESITPTAEAKGVQISLAGTDRPALVWGDQGRLQQVLWNLLANAVKFTPAEGRVLVSMACDGPEVSVTVADTGAGIAPAFLPYVFDRFRQADGSSTRMHSGLGLGLSIVRHLVELHGGRMTADSAGEGKGSTFTLHLPLRTADDRPAVTIPAERRLLALHPDLEGVHVLVVDDDRDARELLRAMLERAGARVTEASSATEALRIFADDRPHIMLADIAMPQQDGHALIRSVRDLPDGAGLQVRTIAVSAYGRREDKRRAVKAGFDAHLTKPVQPDVLYAALEELWLKSRQVPMQGAEPGTKVH